MDNRELATLILLGVTVVGVAVLAIRKEDFRASLKGVGESMVAPAILIPSALLAGWILCLILAANSLGLWDDGLILSAVLWSGATAAVLFFQVATRRSDEPFLRPALRRALAVSVFVEVAASFFVFELWVELIVSPLATLLLVLSLIASREPESTSAKNVIDSLLGFVGIAMALAWIIQFISGFDQFDWGHAERQLGMPVWLTLGLLPFLYLVALWSGYDHAFRRMKMKSADWQVPLRVKLGFALAVHGHASKANAVSAPAAHELARTDGVRSAWRAGRAFLRSEQKRTTEIQEAAERLERYAGVDGVDEEGRRLDQREFKETRSALQWLATAHMGWYDRKARYKDDLLEILTFDGLPEDHGITMRISDDGQQWFAWRLTVAGWCFAIGAAAAPPDQWVYDGADPPGRLPRRGRGMGRFLRHRGQELVKPKARPKIEDTMKLRFSDYDGPTGLLVATGREMLPLDSFAGATAFIGAGMLAGTTDPEESAQIQAAIDAAVNPSGADSATIARQKEKTRPTRGRVV